MTEPLTLVVPADARYRALAGEVAAKYTELVGGSAADGQALAASVSSTVDSLAGGADDGLHLDLVFTVSGSGIGVEIRAGARTSVVNQPLPARKP